MVGISAGVHNSVMCVGVGEKSSWSQWLAISGERKEGRAWASWEQGAEHG